jgi:hypothetical protein
MILDPTAIPLGPSTKVSPFGSVKVSDVFGRLKEVFPITMTSGIEDGVSAPVMLVLIGSALDEPVSEIAGPKFIVIPLVVIASGSVAEGKLIVSNPMIMPLGARITEFPSDSVIVVELEGRVYVIPPIITSAGEVEGILLGRGVKGLRELMFVLEDIAGKLDSVE